MILFSPRHCKVIILCWSCYKFSTPSLKAENSKLKLSSFIRSEYDGVKPSHSTPTLKGDNLVLKLNSLFLYEYYFLIQYMFLLLPLVMG